MPFSGPILLYGAGREARSTRAFLKSHAPDTKIFATVDSGEIELEDVEIMSLAAAGEAVSRKTLGLIVKSPGVSLYKPLFEAARQAGIPITSNLNLWAASYRQGRTVIAITGTKGKSTTATLVHLMFTRSGIDAGLAGNVGVAPLEIADNHPVVVFELSSYQTADMDFAPDIAGFTNLYPEHTDWHGSVDRYFDDKLNLLARDEPIRVALGPQAAGLETMRYALRPAHQMLPELDIGQAGALVKAVRASRLKGEHNLDNARLAARLALAAGATITGIAKGVRAFKPLPHRLEEKQIGSFTFVDDSISTTPEATKAALATYQGHRIALIAGGHERGQDYAELARLLAWRGVTTLLTLPVTGPRLAKLASEARPAIEIIEAETLAEGMEKLRSRTARFDTVILSPGAPSYNQFKNFEERGKAFIKLARKLFK
jgi:UDP-N-acetylmuramoylalanine--D-glutamate ligase